jgi:hypothetical protein
MQLMKSSPDAMTKPTAEQQDETAKLLDEYLQRKQPHLTEAERKTRIRDLFDAFSIAPPIELPPPEREQ